LLFFGFAFRCLWFLGASLVFDLALQVCREGSSGFSGLESHTVDYSVFMTNFPCAPFFLSCFAWFPLIVGVLLYGSVFDARNAVYQWYIPSEITAVLVPRVAKQPFP
jgi:hypothetical protein